MKKIFSCLLVLGMMAGCTQQPVNPPIEPPVDEPETIDEVEDILEIKEHKFNPLDDQISDKHELLTSFIFQIPILNDEREEALAFNQKMNEAYEENLNTTEYDSDGHLRGTMLQKVNAYLNKDILSLVLVSLGYAFESSYRVYTEVYNYNVKTGEFITNEEFFEYFDYNQKEYEEKLSIYLTENFVKYEIEEPYNGDKVKGYDKTRTDCIYLPLVEPVMVYMNEGNLHVVAYGDRGTINTFFDIEIK